MNNHVKITAAGGLVINNNKDLLFIFRNGKWDLPKGKLEDNETISESALREVSEECGISKQIIISKLLMTQHTYNVENQKILKTTHWYLMDYKLNELLIPQIEEGITKVEWIKESELTQVLENTYQSIIDVIRCWQIFDK